MAKRKFFIFWTLVSNYEGREKELGDRDHWERTVGERKIAACALSEPSWALTFEAIPQRGG